MMRFLVESVPPGRPAWWLIDDDGLVLAWSGRTFDTLAVADHAAHRFRVEHAGREYRMQPRPGGSWRWTAWNRAGERIAVSGDWFKSRAGAEHAARECGDVVGAAIGP
ncbi:hypothetical protein [Nocardioides daeguensis]|uniref:DUF1508 domain-containing protein n=1 Tax=Nocardioides daeguensis TaxID=908359 RepID=A0ABP6V923_9ACTN|nr:hypothetical protein [Nocardioides daeguensis]MBV6726457.1 hypothetical protein [Nocardioides daeguensis]MCR1772300.1 hypothetical protein [Nocardioides daeguensis]